MKKIKFAKGKMIGALLVLILLGLVLLYPFYFNDHNYSITVTDKERVYEEKGEDTTSKYLVFGDDENGNSMVFENTDMLLRLKFRSSNIQGKLKVGHKYDIEVIGFRFPLFSRYENIIRVTEINLIF